MNENARTAMPLPGERRQIHLGTVIILVVVFFVAGLGIMIRTEMKNVERHDINPFGLSSKKSRRRAIDGTYILK